MKKNCLVAAAIFASTFIFSSISQAALLDQFTTSSSEFANVYQNGAGVNLYIEGAGVNQMVTLVTSTYTYGAGSTYWKGVIPADALTYNGIASVSVNVDTCTLEAAATYGSNPCGPVNVTFNKGDYLWKTNGVTQYTWGDVIYQIIGGVSTFGATAEGWINGKEINSSRAYMGKYTNVTVTVSTTN